MVETATPPTAPVTGTQETKNDTQTPPVSADVKPQETKDQFAERMELLARKERSLYKEKQRISQERKQMQDMHAKVKAWEESKSGAKKNPLDYLTQAGLSYDELTQFMLNGGKPTEEDKIEAIRNELGQFKKQAEEEKKKLQEEQTIAQQQAQAQVIEEFQEEITSFIETNKTTYELISTRGAEEDVFATIRDQFQEVIKDWVKKGKQGKPPQPLTIKEASDLVEDFYEKEVERLAQTQKMQAKFQPSKDGQPKKGPAPTLTNAMTTSAAASLLPAKNEADRLARALAKLG